MRSRRQSGTRPRAPEPDRRRAPNGLLLSRLATLLTSVPPLFPAFALAGLLVLGAPSLARAAQEAGAPPTASGFAAADLAAAAEGDLAQRVLPAFEARRLAAQARAEAARRFFAGETSREEAFPELQGAPLTDPAFLAGRRLGLDTRARERARERVAPPPEGLRGEGERARRAALDAACDAEETADSLERRLLAALQAGLAAAPGFAQQEIEARRADWRDARALPPGPEDETWRRAARRAAAAGVAEARLARYREAALQAMTVPGHEELGGLAAADLDAAEAIAAARPLGASETEADAPEPELLTAEALTTEALTTEALTTEALTTEALLDRLRRARPLLPPPLAARFDAVAEALVQHAETLREMAGSNATGRDGGGTLAQARRARERAEEAERQAEAAGPAEAGPAARVQRAVIGLRQRIAAIWEAEDARHGEARRALEAWRADFEAGRTEAAEAVASPPMTPGRRQRIDDAYASLRTRVEDVRGALARAVEGLAALRGDNRHQREALEAEAARLPAEVGGPADGQPAAGGVAAWAAASAELGQALEAREDHALAEIDDLLELLAETKAARRRLRGAASGAAVAEARRSFVPELRRELEEIPLLLAGARRQAAELLTRLPQRALDLTAVRAALSGSLTLLLLAAAWWAARRRAGAWARRALEALEARRRTWRPESDPLELEPLAGTTLRRAVDALGALGLLLLAGGEWPLLDLLLLLALAAACLRLVRPAVALALARPRERRPALAAASDAVRSLSRSTLRWLLVFGCGVAAARSLALDVLDADRLHGLVSWVALWFGLVLALVLGVRWAGPVRAGVAERAGQGRFTRWLTAPARSLWSRLPRSLAGMAYLAALGCARLLRPLIDRQERLAWLRAHLVRRQLHAEGLPAVPLAEEVRSGLLAATSTAIARPAASQRLTEAFESWGNDRRRGLIAVIGDEGQGKSVLLERIPELLDPDNGTELPETRRCHLERRIRGPAEALEWLAEAVGVGGTVGVEVAGAGDQDLTARQEALQAALEALPPRLFLLDDMHRLLLRTVDGASPLRAVLDVLHACSEEHFWALGFHRLSWSYLERTALSINLAMFRERIQLAPLTPRQLARWLRRAARASGFRLRYERLVGPAAGRRDLKRARLAYWQLLADLSQGNPRIARDLWLDALSEGGDGHLAAGIFHPPDRAALQELPDADLFVLTALALHGPLASAELAEVLNVSEQQLRATCRHLEGLSILSGDHGGTSYALRPIWRPAVVRHLRQKHFLHGA